MTAGSSIVKLTAKTTLKNKWIIAIAASLIFVFSYFVCNMSVGYIAMIINDIAAYIILAVMAVLLLLPLLLGLIRYFWRLIFSADDKPTVIFYYFSDKNKYLKSLYLIFSLALRAAFASMILFLPAVFVDVISGAKIYDLLDIPIPIWTGNLYYLSVFLKTIAVVILLFIMSKYYIAPFLIIADENMEVAEAIHMSTIIAKDTLLDFILLVFSFFGWILLSVIVFPLIFTLPYFITSISIHTRFAIAEYNKKNDHMNDNSAPFFVAGF